MKAIIYISGKIGKDTTLVDVIRQFKSYEDPTEVLAIIDSVGGVKEEGDAIYNYLEGLKAKIPVNTYAKKAYSISAKIYAVGQERIIDDVDKALMIHFAWAKPNSGTAEYFEAIAEQLREMENEFALFYSGFLDIDETTVRSLLDSETFISGSEAVEIGFATQIKETVEAVAEYNSIKTKFNIEKMTEKKSKKKAGRILLEAMAAFIGVEINAELILQDSDGTEIVFPDLEGADVPKVGDAAKIDGSAIPDGSYVMPSLEEATVVFVDGKVSEIIPKADDAEEETVETEAEKEARLAAEAAEINAEEIKQVSVWEIEVVNTSFAVGDVVTLKGWDGGEDYTSGAGEFQLSDGRRIVTDASGVIVVIKEADAPKEIPVDAEASFEDLLEKVNKKVKAEINAEYEAKLTLKDTEIKALKAKIGSKEFNASEEEHETKLPVKKKSLAEIIQTKRN